MPRWKIGKLLMPDNASGYQERCRPGGVLEFGTEVVVAEDGTIAALLGASPGASPQVSIMLGLIPKCFKESSQTAPWKNKLREWFLPIENSFVTMRICLQNPEKNT